MTMTIAENNKNETIEKIPEKSVIIISFPQLYTECHLENVWCDFWCAAAIFRIYDFSSFHGHFNHPKKILSEKPNNKNLIKNLSPELKHHLNGKTIIMQTLNRFANLIGNENILSRWPCGGLRTMNNAMWRKVKIHVPRESPYVLGRVCVWMCIREC